MMLLVLLIALFSHSPDASDRADQRRSTQAYYAMGDVEALATLLQRTKSREIALLCRYRLYPLTEDPRYLDDLPETLEQATARELALLSGLWGYKVREASVLLSPRYGKRSLALLEAAKALDPLEPFVLLVEGQSLVFRPRLFGGDADAALQHFRTLRHVLRNHPDAGISELEAALWEWYAWDRLGDDRAADLRDELLAQQPPPLYRQFLLDPP